MVSVCDAYDDAMCETFFATLECELLDRRRFKTQAEARIAVFEFIEGFYNPRRRHSSIGYRSPIDYERHIAHPDAPQHAGRTTVRAGKEEWLRRGAEPKNDLTEQEPNMPSNLIP